MGLGKKLKSKFLGDRGDKDEQEKGLPSRSSSQSVAAAQQAPPSEIKSTAVAAVAGSNAAVPGSNSTVSSNNGLSVVSSTSLHALKTTPEASHSTATLWDQAYAQLSSEKTDLIQEYQELLSRALQSKDEGSGQISADPAERRKQMDDIIRLGLEHMQSKRVKVTVAGHEIDLAEQADNLIAAVIWSKDWIGDAVQDVPYANAVWAGVSLILPILTNPSEVEKANKEGFTYVTSQMRWYHELEVLLLPPDMLAGVRADLEGRFVGLYKLIIDFQVQSVLRCYRGRAKNYVRGAAKWDDWGSMLDGIKSEESLLGAKVTAETAAASRSHLAHLAREAEAARSNAEELVAVAKQQLEVQRQNAATSQRLLEVSQERLEMERKTDEERRERELKAMSEKQKKLHQLFHVADYETLKDQVQDRLEGTCLWLLDHPNYKAWWNATNGPLLVSADPGCGKSVLSKYLVDHALPRSAAICYFFFKDRQQTTIKAALCSLIHQLIAQRPTLIRHAEAQGVSEESRLYNKDLWRILEGSCSDPDAGDVIFVLDALDECDGADTELGFLARTFNQYFSSAQCAKGRLKVLLTSRPYEGVTQEFGELEDSFPLVRIHGEQELEAIAGEVDKVVEFRLAKLARKRRLSPKAEDHLRAKLRETPQRTYLWVHLVFRYLEKNVFKNTPAGIDDVLENLGEVDTLPGNIFDVYERTLQRSRDPEEVRKALSIVACAYSPLTVDQLSIALAASPGQEWFDDWADEDPRDFEERLRDLTGLLIVLVKGKVIFIHQTVKDFLLMQPSEGAACDPPVGWKHCLTLPGCHEVLSVASMLFLQSRLVLDSLLEDLPEQVGPPEDGTSRNKSMLYMFIPYASQHWVGHVRDAGGPSAQVRETYAALIGPRGPILETWIFEWIQSDSLSTAVKIPYTLRAIAQMSVLTLQALLGHMFSVRSSLEAGLDIEGRTDYQDLEDPNDYFSPLRAACVGGHEDIIDYLVAQGADVAHTWHGSPLALDLIKCCEAAPWLPRILKTMASRGMDINQAAPDGNRPLAWTRNTAVLRTLCELGADVNARHRRDQNTAIFLHSDLEGVQILLEFGASVDLQNALGDTVLHRAAKLDPNVLRLVVEKGCPIDAQNVLGETPIFNMYNIECLAFLAARGADFSVVDRRGRNPLHHAAGAEHIDFLVERGVDVNQADESGNTPLHAARAMETVEALLKHGARVDAREKHGRTPLMDLVLRNRRPEGHAVTRVLLQHGADVNAADERGRTALHELVAIMGDHLVPTLRAFVSMAREFQLNANARDHQGNTPLHVFFSTPRAQISAALPGVKPGRGVSLPLRAAARREVVELLVDAGADLAATNASGRTVLHEACACALETGGVQATRLRTEADTTLATKLLITRGGDVRCKDADGNTPLDLCQKEDIRQRLIAFADGEASASVGRR